MSLREWHVDVNIKRKVDKPTIHYVFNPKRETKLASN